MTPEPSEPEGCRRKSTSTKRLEVLRQQYLERSGYSPLTMASAGLELAGIMAVLVLGGWWLDAKLTTSPWLMIVGLAIGAVGGLYNLWRRGKRFFK